MINVYVFLEREKDYKKNKLVFGKKKTAITYINQEREIFWYFYDLYGDFIFVACFGYEMVFFFVAHFCGHILQLLSHADLWWEDFGPMGEFLTVRWGQLLLLLRSCSQYHTTYLMSGYFSLPPRESLMKEKERQKRDMYCIVFWGTRNFNLLVIHTTQIYMNLMQIIITELTRYIQFLNVIDQEQIYIHIKTQPA